MRGKIVKLTTLIGLILFLASCGGNAENNDRLINGEPANPKDWPASVYAAFGNSRCTATLVGEKALLTAAHCMKNGGSVTISVGASKYVGKCTHSPNYRGNSTADWALCLLDTPVKGVDFEVVNFDPELIKVGMELTLTGYGCIKPGGGGGNDGIYRIGKSNVTKIPKGNDNDIVTQRNAALCFGDSGGPLFYVNGETRKVVGVNSRGNIKNTSYHSSTSTAQAQSFIKSWAEDNDAEICGLTESAISCRDALDIPPKSDFIVDTAVAHITAKLKAPYLAAYEKLKTGIENLLKSLANPTP